ncbi:MAG: dimethylsulfonioproprionate lyase family protein [Amylibacter sp.]
MSAGKRALQSLLSLLADLYETKGRSGADAAADALRSAAQSVPQTPDNIPTRYADALEKTLETSNHPLAALIIDAIPYIRWGGADLREGRIPDALGNQMPMCELVGPDGMFPNTDVRVGLWMQEANVQYGPRRHAAEETFIQIAGGAFWSTEHCAPTQHPTGTFIHHPSNILHTSNTTETPVFASWRWSGDIGFDKYSMK